MKSKSFIILTIIWTMIFAGGSMYTHMDNTYAVTNNYTPVSCSDLITYVDSQIYVAGWSFDKDSLSTAVSIKVYANNGLIATLSANQTRDDVNNAYGITGKHGYSSHISTTATGTQTITVKAVDPQTNVEYTVGSKSITISSYTNNYNPIGNVEAVTATAGSITIGGWAYDPDSASQSISVKAYIGSTCLGTVNTNITRSDVNSKFSISGKHGFSGKLSTTLTGTQTVTIKAVNLADNKEYTIGSKSVTIPSSYTTKYNPIGNVEAVTVADGNIKIAGWAYDPDSASQSISVKAYVGSICLGTLSANIARPDVNSAFSISGNHGFSGKLSTTLTGTQTVTIKAVDLGSGAEYAIGYKSVTFSSSYTTKSNPIGNVEAVTAASGSITIAGWAYDPDSASQSISVKAYVGSTCLGTLSANIARVDVNSAFSISGNHGFSGKLSTTLTGTQTVTIKAVDLGSGAEYAIGYKSVTFPSSYTTKYDPKGNVEAITADTGSITIAGWAYDPDNASSSISVKAYIGSTCLGTLSANIARPDVNSAFSISGNHGFSGKLSTTLTGTQVVTIKAVNIGSGVEYTIGSKSVTIPSSYTTNYDPIGNVEAITATAGNIKVAGWAFDKDSASSSINVKVYVGSSCIGTLSANQTRDDVNKAYSITGSHGFSSNLTTTLTGTQTVIIKAVNIGSGVEYVIGSKIITIPSSSTTTYTTKYVPKGCVDSIQSTGTGIVYAGGWAYDQDSVNTNLVVNMYIGSTLVGSTNTSYTRSDVNSAYGITGTHGFNMYCTSNVTGKQTVTIKVIDLQTNTEYTIASKSVAIQNQKYSYTLASTLSSTYQTKIDNWIDNNISNTMTTKQKVTAAINYVVSMPYNYNYDSCEKMLANGQGECWGSTDVILHILERIGIPVGIRTRGNTLAYPDYHIENYVMIDGVCYDLNAGKNTTTPRTYVFTPITTPYKYTVKSDGTIKITDYDYYCVNVVVPSTIDGYKVSEIAANAYANHYEMQTVEIPANVTVDTYAFKQCTSLKQVMIHTTTVVNTNAFYCEKTTVLGDDVLWIPDGITTKTITTIN